MLPHDANSGELIGDKNRQAPDLFKGLVYQIWMSVEAWINLEDGETLFLEGAEDFDIVSSAEGLAAQVKATSGQISLRSEVVVKALMSYWLLRTNHSEKRIRFHLITTSSPALERGDFFGGAKGLEVWNLCARTGDRHLTEKLRRFLLEQTLTGAPAETANGSEVVGGRLTEFLRNGTTDEVHLGLIRPIAWLTDSPSSEVIKESVAELLRAYGETMGLRPTECAPASDRLFRIVAETAKKPSDRLLTRDQFRLEFEKSTTRPMSPSESRSVTIPDELAQHLVSLLATLEGGPLSEAGDRLCKDIPRTPAGTIQRLQLVDRVCKGLGQTGSVVIRGASGMGKSTLAKLAAGKWGGSWLWVDFQGADLSNVLSTVKALASKVARSAQSTNVVLDSLNIELNSISQIETRMAALLHSVRGKIGSIIVTTQRAFPDRVLQHLELATGATFEIPYLTVEEVQEFCLQLGCINNARGSMIAGIVHAQTSGHPQLVHATLFGWARQSWQAPKPEEMMTEPLELVRERDLARQLLKDIPKDDRELLYRLSLTIASFRKDHILAIADIKPSIICAGDALTRLLGPWVETAGEGYFRLSPLLSDAGECNWSPSAIRSLRSAIAQAVVSCGRFSLIEATEILMQGLRAEDGTAVGFAAVALLNAPPNLESRIAQEFLWCTELGRNPGRMAFPGNRFVNLLLRLVQFRILAAGESDEVQWLCQAVDEETSCLKGEEKLRGRLLWVMNALVQVKAKISPRSLIAYWGECSDLLESSPWTRRLEVKASKVTSTARGPEALNFLGTGIQLILLREFAPPQLLELAQAVDALPAEKKSKALDYMGRAPRTLQLSIDRAWLSESDKAGQDWTSALKCFDAIQNLAASWGLVDLCVFCCRAEAVIYDEYLNQPQQALEATERGISLNSTERRIIEDQKATILFRRNRPREAAEIWRRVLADWPVEPNAGNEQPVLISRRAADAASQNGDWAQAAQFLQQGQEIARSLNLELYQLTLLADEAFVQWKLQRRRLALDQLSTVLNGLETLARQCHSGFQFHRAWKSIEQIIKWCRYDSGVPAAETWEPKVGLCSNPEADQRIMEIPKASSDYLWLFLAQTEFQLRLGVRFFQSAERRLCGSMDANVRGFAIRLKLSVLMFEKRFASVVITTLDLHYTLGEMSKGAPNAPAYPKDATPNHLVEEAVLCSLVCLAAAGSDPTMHLAQWLRDLKGFTQIVGPLNLSLCSSLQEAIRLYSAPGQSRFVGLLAALRLAIDADAELSWMFLGQASLLLELLHGGFRDDVSGPIGELIRSSWLRRLQFKAQFSSPRTHAPAIQAACDEPITGIRLGARILLRVSPAVPHVRLPPEMTRALEDLARK